MKTKLSILLFGLSFATIQAQDVADAIRIGQVNTSGTARYNAMAGAFGALGGDLSAVSANPAGSVIFNNNQATISLGNFNNSNDSNYFGKNASDSNNSIDINQAGGVFLFENNDSKSDWNKFALAINYQNDNLDNQVFASGVNPTTSIANYFLGYANANSYQNGIRVKYLHNGYYDEMNFADQQAFLGYQTYIINPSIFISNSDLPTSNHDAYVSGVRAGGNYYQENSVITKGYNSNLTLNAAGQYQNWLSVGLNLNFHTIDIRQASSFYESNNNALDATYMVSSIKFNNELFTYGTGFSFQLGAIAKASKEVRFGLTYQSPTWHHLNDEFTQDITATSKSTAGTLAPDVVNPKVVNIYDPYTLQTPSKWTGSLGIILGKRGIISVDYGMKDYSKMKFGPENQFNNPASNNTNNDIKDFLTTAKEIKLGGELKLKQWSLRGGYRFEESPAKNKEVLSDIKGYSAGLGYSWGATKLDFAYSTSSKITQQSMLIDTAKINNTKSIITATMVFEF